MLSYYYNVNIFSLKFWVITVAITMEEDGVHNLYIRYIPLVVQYFRRCHGDMNQHDRETSINKTKH